MQRIRVDSMMYGRVRDPIRGLIDVDVAPVSDNQHKSEVNFYQSGYDPIRDSFRYHVDRTLEGTESESIMVIFCSISQLQGFCSDAEGWR